MATQMAPPTLRAPASVLGTGFDIATTPPSGESSIVVGRRRQRWYINRRRAESGPRQYCGRVKSTTRVLFGVAFVLAGVNHFANPDFYVRIMPPYLPWPLALVYVSGIAEAALGALLLVPRWSRVAAWGLVALLVAIFPANLHMAMNPQAFPDMPPLLLYLRLPLQAVLILWAWWYTDVVTTSGASVVPPRRW